jgi:hypothetical protein
MKRIFALLVLVSCSKEVYTETSPAPSPVPTPTVIIQESPTQVQCTIKPLTYWCSCNNTLGYCTDKLYMQLSYPCQVQFQPHNTADMVLMAQPNCIQL